MTKGRNAGVLLLIPAAIILLMVRMAHSQSSSSLAGTAVARSENAAPGAQKTHLLSVDDKWVETTLRKMSVDE